MTSKRRPGKDLTHDNWDQEEEPEDKGEFKKADPEALKGRVFKTAKRRLTTPSSDSMGTPKSVFSGFSGFGASNPVATTNSNTASPFAFLTKVGGTNGTGNGGVTASITKEITKVNDKEELKSKESTEPSEYSDKSEEYYSKLKGLNQTVSSWIKSHVDINPLCILTPIFKDYEKHVEKIEADEKKSKKTTSGASTSTIFSFTNDTKPANTTTSSALKGFSFGALPPPLPSSSSSSTTTTTSNSMTTSTTTKSSIFGNIGSIPATTTIASSFSFGGSATSTGGTPSGFTFGSTSEPFRFGNVAKPVTTDEQKPDKDKPADEEENNDDEPPKVEFKPVVEENSVYSKRCKVFIKIDGSFKERGIGTCFLKSINDGEKTQMIVRADTSLGNILVNVLLSKTIPVKRLGTNNVMIVCLPLPEFKQPTPLLLKVKTAEEADELMAAIQEHSK